MFKLKNILSLLVAILAIGIVVLPATASAESSTSTASANCPSGKCYTEEAEWVAGTTITTSGGSGSGSGSGGGSSSAIVRETPVSKLKEVKKSYEKKYKVIVGSYQNPKGWQGPKSACVNPEKVAKWGVHPGEFFYTTDHLRNPETAHWHAGDQICNWHIAYKGKQPFLVGTQYVCSNVKSELPIEGAKVPKPHRVYVQFPTMEKFYEIAIKKLEIKSTSQGGSGSGSGEGGSATVETPGHYQCKPGGVLNGKTCKYCPPPSCEPLPCNCTPEPPCSSCHEPEEPPCKCSEAPTVKNVYKIQEVYTNEKIEFCADVYAPTGDNLSILFVTHTGTFSPREIKVSSYGSQSHFCTTYTGQSEPGFDHVNVFVQDHTTSLHCESLEELVEVLAREENPS